MIFSDLLPTNKYSTWYVKLIHSRLSLERGSKDNAYYERHHILPKSIYPQFANIKTNPWNMVLLTAREHFIAHLLLAKVFKTNKRNYYKMVHALQCFVMCCYHDRIVLPSRLVEQIRRQLSEVRKGSVAPNKGVKHTERTRQKMSQNHWLKRGGVHGMLGRHHTTESVQKMRENKSKWQYEILSPCGEKHTTRLLRDFFLTHNIYLDSKDVKKFDGVPVPPPRSNIPPNSKKPVKQGRLNIVGWTISRVAV